MAQLKVEIQGLFEIETLFNEPRYVGYIDEDRFQIKDTFVTSRRSPPLVKGQIKTAQEKTIVSVDYIPSNYQITKYLIGIGVFFISLFAFDGSNFMETAGYAAGFSAAWIFIVTLNAFDSYNRMRRTIEQTLNL